MESLGVSSKRIGSQICHASQVKELTRRGLSTVQLDIRKGDRERVIILGSGWAGYTFAQRLDKQKYQPVIVSPRSYFVFTPLLASTAVGTLEFRNAIESVRGRGRGLNKMEYFQGWGDKVDFDRRTITVEENATEPKSTAPLPGDHDYGVGQRPKGRTFDLEYDKLVIAVGCYSQTFNTPGVKENALFLKDVGDARSIRKRILDCFEKAALPTTPESVRKQLLHFAVVGGGPTGVEFSAELFDLCNEDLKRHYPSLIGYVRITIYDVAPSILSMFDKSLSEYALSHFQRDGIEIRTSHHIHGLRRGLPTVDQEGDAASFKDDGYTLNTKEDGEVGVGMCVWSTGLMMNPFVRRLTEQPLPYPSTSVLAESTDISNGVKRNGKKVPAILDPESAKWTLKRHPKTGALVTDSKFRLQLNATSDADKDTAGDVSSRITGQGVEEPKVPTSIPGSEQANKKHEQTPRDIKSQQTGQGVQTPKVPTSIPGSEEANNKQDQTAEDIKSQQTGQGVQTPKVPTSIPGSEEANNKQDQTAEDIKSQQTGEGVQTPKVPTSIPGSEEANNKQDQTAEDIKSQQTGQGVQTPKVPTSIPGSEQANAKSSQAPEVTVTIANVFALGDVATPPTGPLPATAQVASQEAIWLATRFNKGDLDAPMTKGFHWRNLGMMAYLGGWRGIMQTGSGGGISGWLAWVIWRGAYLTKTISWRNKMLIPIYWMINWVFGRDISRF